MGAGVLAQLIAGGRWRVGKRQQRNIALYRATAVVGLLCEIDMFANTSSVGRTQSIGME
jgi:hypothetical protein